MQLLPFFSQNFIRLDNQYVYQNKSKDIKKKEIKNSKVNNIYPQFKFEINLIKN